MEVITSMIGQAEHDINSQCILITKNKNLIKSVKKFLAKILIVYLEKKLQKKVLLKNGLIIKVYNDKQIIDSINEIAPEHLELNLKNYKKLIKKIYNAEVFVLENILQWLLQIIMLEQIMFYLHSAQQNFLLD